MVLSDGFAYDNDGYEGSCAKADARRALAEARAKGVGCERRRSAAGDTESTIIYLPQNKTEKQTTVNVTRAALGDRRARRKRLGRQELRARARPDYGPGR